MKFRLRYDPTDDGNGWYFDVDFERDTNTDGPGWWEHFNDTWPCVTRIVMAGELRRFGNPLQPRFNPRTRKWNKTKR